MNFYKTVKVTDQLIYTDKWHGTHNLFFPINCPTSYWIIYFYYYFINTIEQTKSSFNQSVVKSLQWQMYTSQTRFVLLEFSSAPTILCFLSTWSQCEHTGMSPSYSEGTVSLDDSSPPGQIQWISQILPKLGVQLWKQGASQALLVAQI